MEEHPCQQKGSREVTAMWFNSEKMYFFFKQHRLAFSESVTQDGYSDLQVPKQSTSIFFLVACVKKKHN